MKRYGHQARAGRGYTPNAIELPNFSVVEYIDEDEPVPAGVYVAGADTQAFSVLKAMIAAGDAEYLGQRRDQGNQQYIAVAVGGQQVAEAATYAANPTIGIGADFFSTALRTYGDYWPEAWWREVVQNSVDAGAHQIDCAVETLPDGNVRASITDNGGGMSREVLLDKFLVLGGTTKRATGGSTGGFGKAKELIILPFVKWEIHSRDTLVYSTRSVIDYEVEPAQYLSGTRVSVVMPPDQCTTAVHCRKYLARCYLPRVRFTVDGESYQESDLRPGDVLDEWPGKAQICYASGNKRKARFPGEMLIRAKDASGRGSLFMWNVWVPSEIKGQLMVEVTGPTIDLFNDSRQQWGDWDLRYAIEDFVRKLSSDLTSTLRAKTKKPEEYVFEGTEGKFRAELGELREREQAALLESVGSGVAEGKQVAPQVAEFSAKQVGQLLEALGKFDTFAEERGLKQADVEGAPLKLSLTPDVAEVMLKTVAVRGPNHVEAVTKQMAWEPDFRLRSYSAQYRIPKRFYPEHMSGPVRKLARYWAEMCRFVMMLLGSDRPFGVGFLFDDGSEHPEGDIRGAEYEHETEREVGGEKVAVDEHWLLVNPFSDGRAMKQLIKLTTQEDLNWIFAAAVHECTHMANNVSTHTELFAAALTHNIARTAGRTREIAKIKKLVLAKEREVTKRLAAERPKRTRAGAPLAAMRMKQAGEPAYHRLFVAVEKTPNGDMFIDTLASREGDNRWGYSRWEIPPSQRQLYVSDAAGELHVLKGIVARHGVFRALNDHWYFTLVDQKDISRSEGNRLLKRWGVGGAEPVAFQGGERWGAIPSVNAHGGGTAEYVATESSRHGMRGVALRDVHEASAPIHYELIARDGDGFTFTFYRIAENSPFVAETLERAGRSSDETTFLTLVSIMDVFEYDPEWAKERALNSKGVQYAEGIPSEDVRPLEDDRWRT